MISERSRPWRLPLTVTLSWLVGGMALSLGAEFAISGRWLWTTPGDLWWALRAARYVSDGAVAFIYEVVPWYRGLPLFPALLAPVVAIGDALGLVDNHPFPLPRPSFWLLLGPYVLALAFVPLYAGRLLDEVVGPNRFREVTVVGLFGVAVFASTYPYGHVEDMLAIGMLIFALVAWHRDRFLAAGLLLAIAIALKHWSALAVFPLLVATPRGMRLRTLLQALSLPLVLAAAPLVLDPEHAIDALIFADTYPEAGHVAPWAEVNGATLVTGPLRVLLVVGAAAIAVALRDRLDMRTMLAALTVVFAVRVLSEPVPFNYYVSPLLAFALIHERSRTGTVHRTLVPGLALLAVFAFDWPDAVWWPVMAFLTVVVAVPAARDCTRSIRARPRVQGGSPKEPVGVVR